jgi:hypothetical protein
MAQLIETAVASVGMKERGYLSHVAEAQLRGVGAVTGERVRP